MKAPDQNDKDYDKVDSDTCVCVFINYHSTRLSPSQSIHNTLPQHLMGSNATIA